MSRFAISVLTLAFVLARVQAEPPNEKLRKEYFEFAKLFSMRHSSFRVAQDQDRYAVNRAADAHALKVSNPLLKTALSEFDEIARFYTAARKGWDAEPFTLEEKKRLLKQTLDAEINEDKAKKIEIFTKAFSGALGKAALDQAMIQLYVVGATRHVAAWKKIIPIARECASHADLEGAVGFDLYIGTTVKFQDFNIENTSKVTLTNITLALESNVTGDRVGEYKRDYVFIEKLEPGDTVRLDGALVNKFPYGQLPTPVRDCLTYSIWCDQGRQEDIVLQMTGKTYRMPVVGMGTIFFRFTRQDVPEKVVEPMKKDEPAKIETRAAANLQYAKKLLKDKATEEKGKQRLKEIVKDFPGTKAATEAEKLLKMRE